MSLGNLNDALEVYAETYDGVTGVRKIFLGCRKCGGIDFRVQKTSDGGIEFSCSRCSEKRSLWVVRLVPTINLQVDKIDNEKTAKQE